jgi:hypothetical protein
VLEINAVAARGKPFLAADNDYRADEEQFQELAEHLLKTYAGRRRTFILQHWEGVSSVAPKRCATAAIKRSCISGILTSVANASISLSARGSRR